jgi:hypothetical protein
LNTDNEFREILNLISYTKKSFVVIKEAANYEILKVILAKKPKIIHISCHGAEEEKEFYIAFEERHTGVKDKFTEKRLVELLGK